jgi:hypothetical protein
MKVEQVYQLVNTTVSEIMGESVVVQEDLSNIVDVGREIISTNNLDNYVKKLVNHIGKVIFDDRVYKGSVPSVLRDSWEYGSILEKITADIPEAQENDSWNLVNGETYNQDVFYQPSISAKFFNNRVTFEVPVSFTELQVKESFSNKEQLNGFLSMIFNAVEKAMTIRLDNLVMRAINNMTAETLVDDLYNEDDEELDLTVSGVKAINLLALYNAGKAATEQLEADEAILNPDFIRFASYTISLYKDRMSKISTLFNIGGKERFTPADDVVTVLLSDFSSAVDVFLQSDVFNKELTSLPKHETVPYWQGSGTDYSFEDVSKIHVKTSSGKVVEASGILGVMFDVNAVGVANLDRRVTTHYNAKAEFYTNYYKMDAGYYNDLNENFIVFFIGQTPDTTTT